MADTCICRTERGRRWTNAGCKKHGAYSVIDDHDTAEHKQIDQLMGRAE